MMMLWSIPSLRSLLVDDPAPTMTKHATQRWAERCAGFDWHTEWSEAARPTKRVLGRIREGQIKGAEGFKYTMPRGGYGYAYSRKSGVVFVLDTTSHTCITVWRLIDPPARLFPAIKPKAKRPGIKTRIIEDSHP